MQLAARPEKERVGLVIDCPLALAEVPVPEKRSPVLFCDHGASDPPSSNQKQAGQPSSQVFRSLGLFAPSAP